MFASFATFLLSNALYFFLFVHGECVALLKFAYQQKLSRLCRRYQQAMPRMPPEHKISGYNYNGSAQRGGFENEIAR